MEFFDDSSKKQVKWWNRNYFFAATIVIVIFNICIFAFANDWHKGFFNNNVDHWEDVFSLGNMLTAFFNSFSHSDWQHVLLNMLCLFVTGLYLERKTGSINFILLITALAFFTSMAISANNLSNKWHGFSGVSYGIHAYIIIDYIFSFQKSKKNKFNTILGVIVITFIYFEMCYSGRTSWFDFEWYPYNLVHNLGHYSGFIAGIVVGLVIQLAQLKVRKETADNKKAEYGN